MFKWIILTPIYGDEREKSATLFSIQLHTVIVWRLLIRRKIIFTLLWKPLYGVELRLPSQSWGGVRVSGLWLLLLDWGVWIGVLRYGWISLFFWHSLGPWELLVVFQMFFWLFSNYKLSFVLRTSKNTVVWNRAQILVSLADWKYVLKLFQ